MTLVLTPFVQEKNQSFVSIHWSIDEDLDNPLYIGAGPYAGIIITKPTDDVKVRIPHVETNFTVWLVDKITGAKHQEDRTLKFHFKQHVPTFDHDNFAMQFLSSLMSGMPVDYVSFFKKLLLLMKSNALIDELQVITKIVQADEATVMPDVQQLEAENEVEEISPALIQELLERAFPDGLTLDSIQEFLRSDDTDLIEGFLYQLEEAGTVKRCENEWIRIDTMPLHVKSPQSNVARPTVAIITTLFVEKLAVDAIIEEAQTVHKYKSGGDSNVYTIGKIGKHNVVATKLAIIGDSMEATISAGSITTRLLGNFQHVEHVFILGVAGGVPHYTNKATHIRRGDVVVSYGDKHAYCYGHSYVKRNRAASYFADDVNVRTWTPKSNDLGSIIKNFTEEEIASWHNNADQLRTKLQEENPDTKFIRPSKDELFLTTNGTVVVVNHPDDREIPKVHLSPVGSLCSTVSQKALSADNEDINLNDSQASTTDSNVAEIRQSIHDIRQRLIANNHLRALDAGFDSVIAAITGSCVDSWAVVLGIVDYSLGSSRGAQEWKPYAAVNAAALLREAILRL